MKQRFVFIDGLRAIAALSVLLFHSLAGDHIPIVYNALPGWLQTILDHSNAGVAIFFVLSGFVIAHSLRDVEPSAGEVGRFMLRRSLRLDPAYWFVIALTIGIGISRGTVYTAPQIASHLVYLQDLLGFPEISPIFWTLCLELQFYLVFALVLLARSEALWFLAFVVSLPLACIPIWHGLFTELWYGFLLGAGAYFTWKEPAVAVAFVVYALTFCLMGIVRRDPFMEVCAVTALVVYYSSISGRIAIWLGWRWIQFLGGISYSLYLIHNPVTDFACRVGNRLFEDSPASEIIFWTFAMLASIACAAVLWLLIERPSIALSRMVSMHGHRVIGPSSRLPAAPLH